MNIFGYSVPNGILDIATNGPRLIDIAGCGVGITYIIGHYNLSVRMIDLVSHTIYVVCVNFIHKWRDLQFKVDSERQI